MKRLMKFSGLGLVLILILVACTGTDDVEYVNPNLVANCDAATFTYDGYVVPTGAADVHIEIIDANGTLIVDYGIDYLSGSSFSSATRIAVYNARGFENPLTAVVNNSYTGVVYYSETFVCEILQNNGMIQINQSQAQPVYEDPAGGLVRIDGEELWLPQDFDNNYYDTYLIQTTEIVDGRTWVEISLADGYPNVWVPLDQVTLLRVDPSIELE